ncbi:hypothetical protein [Pseudomonas amygdali]|uniref:hypothetical protein n=1 Tax=Pseudomonas amygdali TaxID=47877 RepID=UPI0011C3526D|nr:hypothetical protein [Pseudomonas amygdali]
MLNAKIVALLELHYNYKTNHEIMKKRKMVYALLFAMLYFVVPKSFADGGSWWVTCKRTIACPAGQTGSIVQSVSVNGNNVGCDGNVYWGNAKVISNTCVAAAPVVSFSYYGYTNSTQSCPPTQPQGIINTQQRYEVWSDGSTRNPSGWYETSRSCTAIFSHYGYTNSTQTCPATQPQGVINIQQRYEVWSDGSTRNASGWSEKSRTCVAIKSRTQTDSRSYSCPASQSGSITQSRTYDVWSDGTTKNYSAWVVSSNTCKAAPLTANPTQRRELCAEGYKGEITYHWVVYYTNDSYSAYDGDGKLISYVLSTPHQQEVVLSNTCWLIPSQDLASVPGHESMTCDKYYNVVKGTYLGDVVKYGKYVSSYDSVKMKTNTAFIVDSVDVTQCVADPEKSYSTESIFAACAAGQSGQITKTRTVATAPNGSKTYPFGTDYTVTANTCAGVSSDSAPAEVEVTTKTSLIENLSLTSSMVSDSSYSEKIVDMLKSQTIKPGESHKLNLVINDLSAGSYNSANVTNVVRAFKTAVGSGAEFKISLPRSIDKYVGNGDIQNGKGLVLTGSKLKGNQLTVKYMDSIKKKTLEMPVEKSVNIQLFTGDLSGVTFNQE